MDRIKGNFGFGCMRLPMVDDEVDLGLTAAMVDEFMAAGFNYFDTAHGYLGGRSELAVRTCVAERYPRDAFVLTDKLTGSFFQCEADIRPLFESQLEACGVDHFDFYLMHAQRSDNFAKFKRCRAYETAFTLRDEGKVRHVGLSFHDTADVLDRILTEYPEVEVVQLQLNYVDWDDPAVQSRKCLETCARHGKPVIVMEPVKGGGLVNLPAEAQDVLDSLHGGSKASYALRFAAGCPGVFMTLSGMGNLEQMRDNIATMTDFKPLTAKERVALSEVRGMLEAHNLIACTACRYCVDGCPMNISIPDLFACMNAKQLFPDYSTHDFYYEKVLTKRSGKASDCVGCGRCESACPQHLPIRDLLKDVAATFETQG